MTKKLRITADLGEQQLPEADYFSDEDVDANIIPIIDMASIACGGHVGDHASMTHAVKLAKQHGVMIGAHPAYPDRENFGRMTLSNLNLSLEEIDQSVRQQITNLLQVCEENGATCAYIKPHGAIYTDAVRNADIQTLLLNIAKDFNLPMVHLAGPANEAMRDKAKSEAVELHLEAFADRRYIDSGELQPRSETGAVLHDTETVLGQALQIANEQSVTTNTNNTISMPATCLCVHGDNPESIALARALAKKLA